MDIAVPLIRNHTRENSDFLGNLAARISAMDMHDCNGSISVSSSIEFIGGFFGREHKIVSQYGPYMYKDHLVENNSLTGVVKVFCAGSLLLKVL
jgi:hypothetical protein